MLVAHAYSGGRDQEPAWGNNSERPYLEETLHEKGLVEWLNV
jgi:hypothetical protein